MTSRRRFNINRRNAQRSTGPRTSAGKAKSALNAKVHGLSVCSIKNSKELQTAKALAGAFAGDGDWNAPIRDLAYRAAEQQLMMRRVPDARHKAWEFAKTDPELLTRGNMLGAENLLSDPGIEPAVKSSIRFLKRVSPHLFEPPCETDVERDVIALNLVSKQLKRLIRYERQAANARDRALRDLEQAKTEFLTAN